MIFQPLTAQDGPQLADLGAAMAFAPAQQVLGETLSAALAPLSKIEYAPVATYSMGFRRADIAHRLDGFGALVPARAELLYGRLCAPGSGILPTTTTRVGVDRLPGIVSVMVPELDSETLILALDQAGFAVSAASACSSGSLDASHVLLAMGIPREQALGSLRVSFDERVGADTLDRFADTLLGIVDERTKGRSLRGR